MEWTSGLPGVRTRVIPRASSTPRPYERRVSGDPLLASAPDGVSPINPTGSPLQASPWGPPPPQDEASKLACGARVRLTGRPRASVPAKDHIAGSEQGLTARPSPLPPYPEPHKGLSDAAPSPDFEETGHTAGGQWLRASPAHGRTTPTRRGRTHSRRRRPSGGQCRWRRRRRGRSAPTRSRRPP